MAAHEWEGVTWLDRGRFDGGRFDGGRREGRRHEGGQHEGRRCAGREHGGVVTGRAGRVWDLLRRVWHARRTRRDLAGMDDRMLADIGIGRADAYEEARRAPWDVTPRPR